MKIKLEMSFEDHFPIVVMTCHYSGVDNINSEISEILRNLKSRYLKDKNENEVLTGTVATLGGYQTPTRRMFLNRPEPFIQILRDEIIIPSVECYIKKVFVEMSDRIKIRLFSWANILSEGEWQAPHIHPTAGNLASGVYYLKVPQRPSPEGCIEFLNPHPDAVYHGSNLTRRIQPKGGDLIIFPPYYLHYVPPFKGKEERAIVSFDVNMQNEPTLS